MPSLAWEMFPNLLRWLDRPFTWERVEPSLYDNLCSGRKAPGTSPRRGSVLASALQPLAPGCCEKTRTWRLLALTESPLPHCLRLCIQFLSPPPPPASTPGSPDPRFVGPNCSSVGRPQLRWHPDQLLSLGSLRLDRTEVKNRRQSCEGRLRPQTSPPRTAAPLSGSSGLGGTGQGRLRPWLLLKPLGAEPCQAGGHALSCLPPAAFPVTSVNDLCELGEQHFLSM